MLQIPFITHISTLDCHYSGTKHEEARTVTLVCFFTFLLGPVMSFAKLTKLPPIKRAERNIPLGGLTEDIRQAAEAHQADFKMFSREY